MFIETFSISTQHRYIREAIINPRTNICMHVFLFYFIYFKLIINGASQCISCIPKGWDGYNGYTLLAKHNFSKNTEQLYKHHDYKGNHIHSYLSAEQAVFILYVPLHYGFHNRFHASVVQNLLDDPTIGIIEQALAYKISNSGIGEN